MPEPIATETNGAREAIDRLAKRMHGSAKPGTTLEQCRDLARKVAIRHDNRTR